jgi:pentatricopeptide repeat protein
LRPPGLAAAGRRSTCRAITTAAEARPANPSAAEKIRPRDDGHDNPASRPRTVFHRTLRARAANDRAIGLFEKALEKDGEQIEARFSLEWVDHATKLRTLQREDLIGAFRYVVADVLPSISGGAPGVPKTLRVMITNLLQEVVAAKTKAWDATELPTLTEICQVYTSLGTQSADARLGPMLYCLEHLASTSTAPGAYESAEIHQNALARMHELLLDVVGVWKDLSQQTNAALMLQSSREASLGFCLATPVLPRRPSMKPGEEFKAAVASLFPQYHRNQLRSSNFTEALITTYALLTDPGRTSAEAKQAAAPLLESVAGVLKAVHLTNSQVEILFTHQETLKPYIKPRWPAIVAEVRPLKASPGRNATAALHDRLRWAFKSQRPDQIKLAWKEIQKLGQQDEARREEVRQNPRLLDYMIHIWCSLGSDEMLMETTAFMAELGVPTTVHTLTGMIEGWSKVKRISHIERAWQSAVEEAGLKLDTGIWTARISALMAHGRPEDGIKALTEMATMWKDAVKTGAQDAAVRPTIEPVNTVLAGLVRLQRFDVLMEVLHWAAREGIEPNIITFNTLLRPMLREGLFDEANQVFTMMEAQGVKPDAATFTIMSEMALDGIGRQAPDEQASTLGRIFDVMRRAGLAANMQVYGKMLHKLLASEGDTAAAVQAVLAHIHARGWAPSPHIYTMLVQHFFARDDLLGVPAVRSLIASRQVEENGTVDRVFWLRVLKGYGLAGEVDEALGVFDRLAKTEASVDLQDVEPLLRLLVQRRRWEEARGVVRTVAARQEGTRGARHDEEGGDGGRRWRHQFWHLAAEHGLLEGIDEVPGWLRRG